MSCISFGNLRSVSGAETEICTAGLSSRLSNIRKYRNMPMKLKLLTPNVNYNGRTAPLTSKVAFYIFIQQI